MKFLLVNILILSIVSLAYCQDNSTTTTTFAPITTTTTSITTTTLDTTTTTLDTTTTTLDTTTTSLAPNTTTTTTAPASTTTTTAETTTSQPPAPKVPVLSFRVPNNVSIPACLKVNVSLQFDFTYLAEFNKTKFNQSVKIALDNDTSYSGECGDSYNTLKIEINDKWSLLFNYTLISKAYYELNTINLTYFVNSEQFPNVSNASIGQTYAAGVNLTEFSANKGNSYKCFAETDIKLSDNVTLVVTNYFAQPFLSNQNPNLDTAVECPADTTGTSKLVPIIVGSALAVLVVLVLVAYIIGRRKHRPGYQQV